MYRFCLKKQRTCRVWGHIRSSEDLFGTERGKDALRRESISLPYRPAAALWANTAWDMLSKSNPPIFEMYWHNWHACSCFSSKL